MHRDPINTMAQGNMLALNAMIEAARAGEAGRDLSRLAAELRELVSNTLAGNADTGVPHPLDAAALLRETEVCCTGIEQQLAQISKAGDQISSLAHCATSALWCGDQESQVVDYHDDQANCLRGLVRQIEAGQRELEAAVSNDRAEIKALMDSFRRELEATQNGEN